MSSVSFSTLCLAKRVLQLKQDHVTKKSGGPVEAFLMLSSVLDLQLMKLNSVCRQSLKEITQGYCLWTTVWCEC